MLRDAIMLNAFFDPGTWRLDRRRTADRRYILGVATVKFFPQRLP